MSFRRATKQLAELGDVSSVEGARHLAAPPPRAPFATRSPKLYSLRPKPSESMLTGDATQDGTLRQYQSRR